MKWPIAIIAASLLAWCEIRADAPANLVPVTIAEYGEFPLYASLYVADAKGYFVQEGLKVTIVPAGGDEKVFAALLAGSAQFGVGDPIFTVISGEKGRPGRIVCSILQSIPGWGIANDPKVQQISSPADLKGLSVGAYPAPSTSHTLIRRLFQMGNLPPNVIGIAYGSTLAALQAEQVDIVLEYEPVVSRAVAEGSRRVFSLSDYFPEFALTGLSVLPEYAAQNPAIVQKVINAFQRAFSDMHADLAGIVPIIAKRFPEIPAEHLSPALTQAMKAGSFPKSCHVTKRAWEEAVKLRRDVGDLQGKADFNEYFVPTFADIAAK
ncbi:MAG: hypothetical protein DCC75_04150 [Proteobacteria bacterium]|nr:MAG: hypothetical protein DCC75_04150 [Pseudomonadota bacterium]